MTFLKKQAAGFYFATCTAVLAIVGLIYYMINTSTAYFANLGTDALVVGCIVVAVVAELVLLVAAQKMGNAQLLDLLFLAATVLIAIALVRFGTARVNGIAAIMTFENNAQTMADLSSAITGMVCLGAAMVSGMIASFCNIVKQ